MFCTLYLALVLPVGEVNEAVYRPTQKAPIEFVGLRANRYGCYGGSHGFHVRRPVYRGHHGHCGHQTCAGCGHALSCGCGHCQSHACHSPTYAPRHPAPHGHPAPVPSRRAYPSAPIPYGSPVPPIGDPDADTVTPSPSDQPAPPPAPADQPAPTNEAPPAPAEPAAPDAAAPPATPPDEPAAAPAPAPEPKEPPKPAGA